jgi:hypothetical protein
MKNIASTTIFILFVTIFCQAQNWAPIGAKWHYDEHFAFRGDMAFFLFESIGDTVVLGKNCRIIQKNDDWNCDMYYYSQDFMYESGDTVFFYDPILNDFQILYNFNASVGDSWNFILHDNYNGDIDSTVVYVDSVDYIVHNGLTLKRMFHTATSQFENYPFATQQFTAIERIGSPYFMFPLMPEFYGLCDGNYTSGLRCYEDSTLGLYIADSMFACDYTYVWVPGGGTSTERLASNLVKIYPNPATAFLQVEGMIADAYEIYNLTWQLVDKGNVIDNQIDINNLVQGVYQLRLQHKANGSWQWFRLLKI